VRILFCDICNESVPEGDLDKGLAFLRKGRVVCVSCDAAMAGGDSQASEPQPVSSGTPKTPQLVLTPDSSAREKPAPARSAARTWVSGNSGLASLGLLAVFALCAYVLDEFRVLRSDRETQRSELQSSLRDLGHELDDMRRRSRDDDLGLRGDLNRAGAAVEDQINAGLDNLRADLVRETGRLDGALQQLATVGSTQRQRDEAHDERLDTIFAQVSQSRERLAGLEDRLRVAEDSAASAKQVVTAPVPAPQDAGYGAIILDFSSADPGVRWNAVQAFGATGDPAVVPHLALALKDTDVFVRMAAARILGDLAAPTAIEPLIGGLEDEEAIVREAAMGALHGITGRNFRFDPAAKPGERAKRVKAWRAWWSKARSEYFGNS
jgi:hypothetical protein